MTQRQRELADRLGTVDEQVSAACAAAGRVRGSVTLIAVSKTWPVDDIALLRDLGVRDFGENRADELLAKAQALPDPELIWHFVGQIQSKKAHAIGRVAHYVHSVDRRKVVTGLGSGARDAGRELGAFVQVSLADMAAGVQAAGRGGAEPAEVPALADAIADEPGLILAGVMTLPPLSADPAAAFSRIAAVSAGLRQRHPAADGISAGMSHDFVAAIAAGATHVRIGSAVFGERQPVR